MLQRKTDISSSHLMVVTTPEISRRNIVCSSGLSHMLSSRHYGSGFVKARAQVFVSETPESLIPEMGDLATRGLRQSDGSNLSRGLHIGKSRNLVNGNPDSVNPNLPKWEVSGHVASVNRTAHNCSGVSTMENFELLSTEIPILRFLISKNGRSHDTWSPSIGRLTTAPGFPPWKVPIP
jgi:hypothetical protein